jgi:membrane associated rhomboid family serine protease
MAHVGGFVFGALAGLLLAAVRPRPSPAPRW